jgi:dTMP kinase
MRALRSSRLHDPHPYPGRLITVEGIDGSGKSTQLLLLERWLASRGYRVHFTEWNSSRLVRRSMKRGKKKDLLTPTTFSLLHAVDFADRLTYEIIPPLKAGMIVLADRYAYTAFGRDVARGVDARWVRAVYSFAPRPDLALYFRVPIDVSLERLLAGRTTRPAWTSGWPPTRPRASACSRAACSTSTTSSPGNSGCASSTRPATSRASRRPSAAWCTRCSAAMRDHEGPSVPRSARNTKTWYGHGLPYLKIGSLPGHLIVVEGTDGVGRSTQIELLRPWLELQGHAVSNTGWTRSPLLSDTINEAKAGHELTVLTFSLLYAADFADRLEHQIIPALRAGFIVIADRYMYTAFARNTVMGADPAWTRELFGFALVPDLVLYLEIDVETLVPRVLEGKGMDYWESGMHLALGSDIFDSFQRYQRRLIEEYNALGREFGFMTVDARNPVDDIQARLRAEIARYLGVASARRKIEPSPAPVRSQVRTPARASARGRRGR